MNRCLYCYAEIEGKDDFHKKCSRKFFGTTTPPALEYSLDEMNELAKKIVRKSTTIPGVQSKISLSLNKENRRKSRLTLVGLWGEYILKPPSENYPELPANEDLSMHLAEIFKIKVVPHTLIKLKSGELAYLTKRIDRASQEKIHMEDMCQLTERLTEDKYKGSFEQVAKAIDKYSSNPGLDKLTFFEVVLFSFLTGNADMHLKNFSLIDYPENMTSLTPAYDLLSTRLVIPEDQDPEEMALTLNGRKRKLNIDDFDTFGNKIGLNRTQLRNSYSKFSKNAPKAISLVSHSEFLSQKIRVNYVDLISERMARLGLK